MRLSAFALLAAAVPSALAWGNLGHMTVAYVAQDFASSAAASYAQSTVGIYNSSYLASVATWADTYRYTTAGKWSAPLHFIDANDDPTNDQCSVDYNRDCDGDACVVAAIANYTQILNTGTASKTQLKQAMEFLVHFVGDSAQPLHDEAYEVGGNDISVTFGGASTNLHHVWDTNMPEKLIGGSTLADARTWATTISNAIRSGQYASEASSWASGVDINDMQNTAMGWASDANALVCSNALASGTYQGQDLAGQYYQTNIPVVQKQIAKAGYRLATVLNQLSS